MPAPSPNPTVPPAHAPVSKASAGLHVQVQHLSAGAHTLLQHWALHCPPASITTVMGPSGCGKSTLLMAVAGTLAPGVRFDGEVWLDGHRIDTLPVQQRRVGLLFQDDLLFAHMSVLENLLFAIPRPAGLARSTARAQATEQALAALAEAELGAHAHANPATLSGGQRARVSALRALLAQPQALLLDEPFARLDMALRQRFREFVFNQCRTRGIPTLLVTHDPQDVAEAGRVVRMAQAQ